MRTTFLERSFRSSRLCLILLSFVAFLCYGLNSRAFGETARVAGFIKSIDADHNAVIISANGEARVASLFAGDRDYLEPGDRVRGVVVSRGERDVLELVWPDDPKVTAQMLAVNNQLRRDTEVRGRKVFRSIGERLPPFALYNQFGELVRESELRGKTCVINFIFTRCMNPRMCPAATAKMHQLQKHVKKLGLDDVIFLSMTLDPLYDTPGTLNGYASSRGIDGSSFYFLTGPQQPLLDLKEQLGILSEKDPKWIIDHTMRTILVNPKGEIVYQVPGSMWDVEDFTNRIRRVNTNEGPSG